MQEFCGQLVSVGWTADDVGQAAKEVRARHSQHAGVSLVYLLQDFVELAQEKSREVDPTFLELKDVFWCRDHKLGQDVRCPRDGKLGCALVDMLPTQHRQKQNHFMSWSWQYSLWQLCLGRRIVANGSWYDVLVFCQAPSRPPSRSCQWLAVAALRANICKLFFQDPLIWDSVSII